MITLLVPILTLLSGPQALYKGPQNFNFIENLVNGNWFSTAQASDDLELLQEDSDMMFFIHKIHVILQTIEFHIHRRNIWEEDADGAMVQENPGPPPWIKGMCVPIIVTASKTEGNFNASHNMIFLKDMGPHRFAIFCAHSNWHGKKRVVNALSWTPPVSFDVMQRFKNYCKSHRISPANTISLTGTGAAP
ncbi:unnamed protein product [Nyctereutes procyonoides]|uniref:(raccoon dog) hypothetical protein n=1 Tax=Nyctereutes procyonoides TaxID=34880 RepID=A0A811XYQ4_NYCPR|nr:unnamed protein product [Nyctereutes procyonoides]